MVQAKPLNKPFSLMSSTYEHCHIFDQCNVTFVKFYNRILKCENTNVNFITKLAQVNYHGSLNGNIMYIKWKYNVNMLKQNMYECNHVINHHKTMLLTSTY